MIDNPWRTWDITFNVYRSIDMLQSHKDSKCMKQTSPKGCLKQIIP